MDTHAVERFSLVIFSRNQSASEPYDTLQPNDGIYPYSHIVQYATSPHRKLQLKLAFINLRKCGSHEEKSPRKVDVTARGGAYYSAIKK